MIDIRLLIIILLGIEWIAMVVVGVCLVAKLFGFERRGVVEKQPKLGKVGRILSFSGTVIAIALPRILNIRYDHSTKSTLANLFIFAIGFCILAIGAHFSIMAFKPEAETPKWIRKISSLWG